MLRAPLIRKHRTAARVALYMAPVLLAGAIWGVIRWLPKEVFENERSWLGVDYESIESVRLLQEYLRVDTSDPSGSEIAGAELLARWLEAEGIEVHVERSANATPTYGPFSRAKIDRRWCCTATSTSTPLPSPSYGSTRPLPVRSKPRGFSVAGPST
ncbi:MAG: hypothetical protein HC897_00445 [Thermoanaerobaculia bacterium]|nr:hypothetical protein [Thermoanaerobaculia bacterium]